MRRALDALRRWLRSDARDGWVASVWGDLPLLFVLPILFLIGIICAVAGFIALFQPPWWRGALVLLMGVVFLWMAFQLTVGWRNRRTQRR